VVRLRSPFPNEGLLGFGGVVGSPESPFSRRSELLEGLRSLDDRECARPLLSRMANALVGDFSVLGIASSSMVLPRDLEEANVSVRLRMVMPCRCLSFRFCPCQLLPRAWIQTWDAHMATARVARVVEVVQPCYVAGPALAALIEAARELRVA